MCLLQRNKELLKIRTLSLKHIIFIHYVKTALLQEQNTYGINLFWCVFMINCYYKAYTLSNSKLQMQCTCILYELSLH